ncbi:MAG: hypothetical protein WBZ37_11290, partial [Mycobacterium sp.]
PSSALGGIKSIIQSHELSPIDNKTEPGRVVLGYNSMTSTGCILLNGAYLPERSVLAAGSVLPRAKEGQDRPVSSLYGGAPARLIREIKEAQWWDRAHTNTPVVEFDDEKFRVE